MRKYINTFLNLVTFHHSYAIRVSVVIGYSMLFILIYSMLFGNPFTSENHTESVEDYYLIHNNHVIQFDKAIHFHHHIYPQHSHTS